MQKTKSWLNTALWCFSLLSAILVGFVIGNKYATYQPKDENPFLVGQVVYPSDDFAPTSDYERLLVERGAVVVDITRDFIRVRFIDGSEVNYEWQCFEADRAIELTDAWLLGNPFVPGQEICFKYNADPAFPDRGVVVKADWDAVYIYGFDEPFEFRNYERCSW